MTLLFVAIVCVAAGSSALSAMTDAAYAEPRRKRALALEELRRSPWVGSWTDHRRPAA